MSLLPCHGRYYWRSTPLSYRNYRHFNCCVVQETWERHFGVFIVRRVTSRIYSAARCGFLPIHRRRQQSDGYQCLRLDDNLLGMHDMERPPAPGPLPDIYIQQGGQRQWQRQAVTMVTGGQEMHVWLLLGDTGGDVTTVLVTETWRPHSAFYSKAAVAFRDADSSSSSKVWSVYTSKWMDAEHPLTLSQPSFKLP